VVRALREARGDVHIAAVIPETFADIEGPKPLGHPVMWCRKSSTSR